MAKKKDEKKPYDDVVESAHKIWLAGLGALAAAEEGSSKLFRSLVERGEEFEARGKKSIDKVRGSVEKAAERAKETVETAWERMGGSFDEKVADALHRIGVPTRDEIGSLTKRVESLTAAVEKLRKDTKESKPRATAAAAK